MDNFQSLGLPAPLLKSLEKMNFTTPTPIQAQSIPKALKGQDILGSAQTGTGKTAAFGIPLVNHLLASGRSSAMIMTPTRELAMQVKDMLEKLIGSSGSIKAALLIGGESMPKQTQQLRAKPRLIVGTPGRINDHIERGNLMLHMTDFLVLDETDRMLDMGFEQQIEKVVKFLPKTRQTLLFSATLPKNIIKMSEKYLNNPARVSVDPEVIAAPKIKQEIIHLNDGDKFEELVKQLEERSGSVIVFMKTKWNAKKMAGRLEKAGHTADAIHGDLTQNTRSRVIESFRNSKYRVMVATDIAARGLDIPHIEHVINYDLPQCPEDYIHRIGRTARAGAEGSALCFLTPGDQLQWREISKLLDPATMPQADFPQGNVPQKTSRGGRGSNSSRSNSTRRSTQKRRRPDTDRPRSNAASRDTSSAKSSDKSAPKSATNKGSAKSSSTKPGTPPSRRKRAGGNGGSGGNKKFSGRALNIHG